MGEFSSMERIEEVRWPIEAVRDKERVTGHTLTEVEEEKEELSCLLRFLAKAGREGDGGMVRERETSHCLGRQ